LKTAAVTPKSVPPSWSVFAYSMYLHTALC